MGGVNFDTYSDHGTSVERATLILTDSPLSPFSSKSQFSILKSSDLDLSIATAASSSASATNKNIFIYSTPTAFSNLNLTSEYSAEDVNNHFVYAQFFYDKAITFTNMHTRTSGSILYAPDHIAIYVNNFEFDGYKAFYCFNVEVFCIPGGFMVGGLFVDGMKFYQSQDEIIPYSTAVVMFIGPGNVTLNNIEIDSTYITFPTEQGIIFAAYLSF